MRKIKASVGWAKAAPARRVIHPLGVRRCPRGRFRCRPSTQSRGQGGTYAVPSSPRLGRLAHPTFSDKIIRKIKARVGKGGPSASSDAPTWGPPLPTRSVPLSARVPIAWARRNIRRAIVATPRPPCPPYIFGQDHAQNQSKRRVGKGGPSASSDAPTWGPPLPTRSVPLSARVPIAWARRNIRRAIVATPRPPCPPYIFGQDHAQNQ